MDNRPRPVTGALHGAQTERVLAEFVIYPREGHGVSEAAHQYDFMQCVVGRFEKNLKDVRLVR